MTESYFTARVFQMCQDGKVQWSSCDEGGFVTQINGVNLRIAGDSMNWIVLYFSDGFRRYAIREPLPHISQAPLGKLVSFIRKCVGLPPLKGPTKSIDKDNYELRSNLIAILDFAARQVVARYKLGNEYNYWQQEIFQQVVYGQIVIKR